MDSTAIQASANQRDAVHITRIAPRISTAIHTSMPVEWVPEDATPSGGVAPGPYAREGSVRSESVQNTRTAQKARLANILRGSARTTKLTVTKDMTTIANKATFVLIVSGGISYYWWFPSMLQKLFACMNNIKKLKGYRAGRKKRSVQIIAL